MFTGFVMLEGTLTGSVLVENTSEVPINADALPTFRVYGPNGFVTSGACTLKDSAAITAASNATPIEVSCTAHGLTTGARVTITGVLGNTNSNGTHIVTRVNANLFSLDDSVGNGPYSGGGTWNATGLYQYSFVALGTLGFEAGENYQILFSYLVSTTSMGQLHSFNVD